jgi:hypothetical protein
MPLLSAAHDTAVDINPESPAKRPKTAKLERGRSELAAHALRELAADC